MPWRRFGVPIAVIVVFFALGRITSLVVDWAWFSSIGYVGVFWTGFITKAALFVVVLAVSTFALLWAKRNLGPTGLGQGGGRRFRRHSTRASRPFGCRPGRWQGRTGFRYRHCYGGCSSSPSRSSSDCSSPLARWASGISSSGSSTR